MSGVERPRSGAAVEKFYAARRKAMRLARQQAQKSEEEE